MNHVANLHPSAIPRRPAARSSMTGWGISLLVHVLAMAWVWHAWPPRRIDTDTTPARQIEVRLLPITREAPAPVQAPAALRSAPVRTRAASRPAPSRQAHADTASPTPAVITSERPTDAANVTEAGNHTGTDAPTVDLAAARAIARQFAGASGKSLVALPARKPVVDANADHHVVDPLERARRVDCQTARAGSANLLANVILLGVDLVKNAVDDSGCKW